MTNCYIWDTPARMPKDSDGDSVYFNSPRAGGKYKITGTAAAMRGNLDLKQKGLLTTWLCNQRRGGIEYPTITSEIINSVKTFRPLTTAERIERALLYFNQTVRVGEVIGFSTNDTRGEADEFGLMAETESLE